MIMNNRGWIKIVEAFVAILLVISVLLIVINQGYIGKEDISSQVYDIEVAILREIQLDDTLRNEILNANTLPIEVTSESVPGTWDKINDRIPNYLTCEGKICWMGANCELEEYPAKDVYAQSVAITTTLDTPEEEQLRQLKLFCWLSET